MNSNPRPSTAGRTSRIHRTRRWLGRRRTAVFSSALRGAAYATGAGIVGLGFFLLQQQI
ncbi:MULTISPECIES: hypothetical protein [Streptomyces]|uniref:Uncharacterized protein n=2 Tax=Streptomyces TaxID=1883 RepID=A0ABU4K244_9ACTN|nr:hypothetical protein [Streptomyces roseolus]MDX2291831.1 hypothetical protein [Streptomyces roseolus]